MRAVLAAETLLDAAAAVIPGLDWQDAAMRAALSPDLFATAEAMRLVAEGTPFRDAYRDVGTHLDALAVPEPADALAAYQTPGGPGHVGVPALRGRIDAALEKF